MPTFHTRSDQEDDVEVITVELEGRKVPKDVCEWIDKHVESADYEFQNGEVVILYTGDGTPPPRGR